MLSLLRAEDRQSFSPMLAPNTLAWRDQDQHPWHNCGGKKSNIEQKTLTMEEIDKRYPATTWTHIYTENAIRNGGCGVFIKRPGLPSVSLSKPGGSVCSNYKAELLALYNATEALKLWGKPPNKLYFSQTPFQHCSP